MLQRRYCRRTSNREDAEDLAQDIIAAIYESVPSLRCDDAFYVFMWSVAGNVYKGWCRKKSKNRECELTDNLLDATESQSEDNSEVYLLRRELTLLSEKYRKAVILYYIENMSCSKIAASLSISESMVKYLLFKSRQILKEGMNMERNYGRQSFAPKELKLLFWGNGNSRYYYCATAKYRKTYYLHATTIILQPNKSVLKSELRFRIWKIIWQSCATSIC